MLFSVDMSDKRYRIMRAAAKMFARKGFYRAKMEEIAQEADVGKGTVYEYFSSKEQLFIEMFKAGREYYLGVLTGQLENETDIYDKLINVAYLHLTFINDHKDIAMVMMQEFLQLGTEMHQAVFQAHKDEIEALNGIFKQGVMEGYFRDIDTKLTAYIFYGSVHAMGAPMIFQEEILDLKKIAAEIVDIFMKGIINETIN